MNAMFQELPNINDDIDFLITMTNSAHFTIEQINRLNTIYVFVNF